MQAPPAPRFAIAMCTLNGAAHLAQQLDSLEAQSLDAWDLWVSDDGSHDATRAILADYAARWQGRHRVHVIDGPRRGVAANFLTLLCDPRLPADRPVALSDQDDIWFPDKLARAGRALASAGPGQVLLYGAQSLHVSADLQPLGPSRAPRRAPAFANALAQNIVSGHSAVLSPGALALLRRAGVPQAVPFHDWWLYQLISGAGGQVVVDDAVVLAYRQHPGNAIGAHRGARAMGARLATILSGTYGAWIRTNLAALTATDACLTPPARRLVEYLGRDLNGSRQRIGARRLMRAGLYRQSRLTTAALTTAALLGRI